VTSALLELHCVSLRLMSAPYLAAMALQVAELHRLEESTKPTEARAESAASVGRAITTGQQLYMRCAIEAWCL